MMTKLLIILAGLLSATAETLPYPDEIVADGIPHETFSKLLRSEANSVRGVENWAVALKREWSAAEKREASKYSDRRRAAEGLMKGGSPFVICDHEAGKTGEDSELFVQDIFGGRNITAIYNKDDMTCFLMEAYPSELKALPQQLAAAPMTVDMKLAENVALSLLESSVPPSKIEAVFCPGEAGSDSTADGIASRILDDVWADITSGVEFTGQLDHPMLDEKFGEGSRISCGTILKGASMEASKLGLSLNIEESPKRKEASERTCAFMIANGLASQPEICFVEVTGASKTFNVLASALIQSGSPSGKPLYDVGLDGRGQVIGLSDTGLDTDNCYMWDARIQAEKTPNGRVNNAARKVVQYRAVVDSSDTLAGHGTHVAATIAGRKATNGRDESDGDADGIARAAKLSISDIGTASGDLRPPNVRTLLTPGYNAGARIHSASWGTPTKNTYGSYDAALDTFMYENPHFLFVSAAGNDGEGNVANTVGSPAICKNGIGVGASLNAIPHSSRSQAGPDYVAYFSSNGPSADGRLKPDLIAPGLFLKSARAVPSIIGECDDTNDDGVFFKAGTSMATPVVSGAAALVRQYFNEGWHVTGRQNRAEGFEPRSSLLKAVLVNGAVPLKGIQSRSGGVTRTTPYSKSQGFGRVHLLNSLSLATKNDLDSMFINSKSIKNGQTHVHRFTIRGNCNSVFSTTLAWTDPPGAPGCNKGCLLNDLDLFVTQGGISGRLFPNGKKEADRVNNIEKIQIKNLEAGALITVHVRAVNLLRAQEYSLAVTGCLASNNQAPTPSQPEAPTPSPPSTPSAPTEPENEVDTSCVDKSGRIFVSDTAQSSCLELSRSLDAYGYLCGFRDVAMQCPQTCKACNLFAQELQPRRLQSQLTGNVRWYGATFDVTAKQALIVNSFGAHITGDAQMSLEVYQRSSGTRQWSKMCEAEVTSIGYGKVTYILESACSSISLAQGATHSFYVTARNRPDLVLTKVDQRTVMVDTAVLRAVSGQAVTYFDGATFDGYSFDGAISISVVNGECRDNVGDILMQSSVGLRSCAWLSANFNRFSFECNFAAPSSHCPKTCQTCGR